MRRFLVSFESSRYHPSIVAYQSHRVANVAIPVRYVYSTYPFINPPQTPPPSLTYLPGRSQPPTSSIHHTLYCTEASSEYCCKKKKGNTITLHHHTTPPSFNIYLVLFIRINIQPLLVRISLPPLLSFPSHQSILLPPSFLLTINHTLLSPSTLPHRN